MTSTAVAQTEAAGAESIITGMTSILPPTLEPESRTLMGRLSGFNSPTAMTSKERVAALRTGDVGFVHSWDMSTSVDGPGTRMTVFMSGCPLRCLYCHNPDTWRMRDGTPVYLDAMIDKVRRYRTVFTSTGGGITFSGGEAMMQPAFVSRTFRAARQMGVHTCLDTSGAFNRRFKVTGGRLAPTIAFGKRLAEHGVRIWVRFVLVPDLTDDPENVEQVAAICEQFGDAVDHIDVLPFHQLGRPKWHELGIDYPLEDTKPPSVELKQRVVNQFKAHGFTVY